MKSRRKSYAERREQQRCSSRTLRRMDWSARETRANEAMDEGMARGDEHARGLGCTASAAKDWDVRALLPDAATSACAKRLHMEPRDGVGSLCIGMQPDLEPAVTSCVLHCRDRKEHIIYN